MRRCPGCGTRLEPDWDVCWLCHAPAPVGPEEPEGTEVAAVAATGRDAGHVASGPLARASERTVRGSLSGTRASRPGMGRRGRRIVTAAILVFAVASTALFLPYVTYALIYGVFIAALSGYAVAKLWRGHT